jgi:hypothetical protein
VLDTRVLSFRVFTNENGVDIVVWCFVAGDGNAWPNVGEKVKGPSEGQVEGNVSLPNCFAAISRSAYMTMHKTHSVSPKDLGSNIRDRRNRVRGMDIPLRATVFFFMELTAESGMTVFPPFKTGVTSTSSHWIGT